MRVLALVTDGFGGRGGIAQYNRDFLTALIEVDAVQDIQVLPRNASDRPEPPTGIDEAPPILGRVRYTLRALARALARKPDVVFCGHLYMAPLGFLAARLAGAKVVLQMHGVEVWKRPGSLQRWAVADADLVLCVSRHTRERVLEWSSIDPAKVAVLPNTVSSAFTPGAGAAARAAWGLDGKKVLLTVGRIDSRERYKGHDLVIAAVAELVGRGHDVTYLVLGEGDDAPRLKALAEAEGIAERVRFEGRASPDDLVEAYRAADLFVMPSSGEGFGIVFLEAMACGTLALGLGIGGARDALDSLGVVATEEGLVDTIDRLLAAPAPDPHELARAVRARFGAEAFRTRLGIALDRLLEPA